jgi:hypothetical protein
MQDTFTVPVNLSLAEWYELSIGTLPRVKPLQWVLWMITGVSLVVYFPAIISGGVFHPRELLSALEAPAFFLCFMAVGMLAFGWYYDKYKPEVIRGFACRFSPWGLEIAEPPYQTSMAWRQFTRWKETRSLFLLYGKQNNIPALYYVQKRMLPPEITVEEFKQFLANNITAR